MPHKLVKKANLYPQKHRSGRLTWIVNVGRRINGKPDLRRFTSQHDAKTFQAEWNLKLIDQNTEVLADLQGVARHEVLAALGKLKVVGATLNEAIDFFLRFGRPPRGSVSIQQAVDSFLEAKRIKKRSEKYQRTIEHTTLLPFDRAIGAEQPIRSVTREQVENFLHGKGTWSSRTIKTHHDYLATFFRWCLKHRYVLLNPVEGFEVPKITKSNVTYWEPHEVWVQLQTALEMGRFAELAVMALTSFCGVRIEETVRIDWGKIDLETRQLTMDGEHVKTGRRRFAEIPPVAIQWLRQIPADRRTGAVTTVSAIKNGLKRLRDGLQSAGWLTRRVQNGYRQAFAACHYAIHHDAQFLSELMVNSPSVIRSQYHELVSSETAERFFAMFPKRTLVEGVAMALEQDLFDLKEELERVVKSSRNPLFAYMDASGTAKLFEHDEIQNLQVRQESMRQKALSAGEELDLESWPQLKEKPLSKKLAKAFYVVHQIERDFGFSPVDSAAILRLKRVRDSLETKLNVDLSETNFILGSAGERRQD